MQRRSVIVIGGGGAVDADLVRCLPDGAPVVAADSGVDAAAALGLHVDVVVGDLDSASPEAVAAAEAAGARVERHPEDKDATDLALALDRAASIVGGEGDVVVAGVEGGRLDHLLAGILALADPRRRRLRIRAHLGRASIHVLHGPGELTLEHVRGHVLTLLPVGGDAVGVRTTGLRFPLRDEPLSTGTTRGVSNVVDDDPASVALESGTLLVVLPGTAA
jgi:thiamine pyrophosphokinase